MTGVTINRGVHYVGLDRNGNYVCRAATVTEVADHGVVGLAVIEPTGMLFIPLADGGVPYFDRNNPPPGVMFEGDASGAPGTWHWPERA